MPSWGRLWEEGIDWDSRQDWIQHIRVEIDEQADSRP